MEGSEDISLETLPIISQFECKELLGSGVFGKVYLSKDPATGTNIYNQNILARS